MIGNISDGKGFRGTLNYLLREGREQEQGQEATIVGGNMAGRDARELAREFKLSYEANPRLDKLVKHISLSLLPREELSRDRWADLADEYMREMGYTDNQFVAILHTDTLHQHIHIVASRGRLENPGRTNTYKERWRSQRVLRRLENQFGLTPVRNSEEIERKQPEVFGELQEAIGRSLEKSINPDQFARNLSKDGVEVSYRRNRSGEITGVSYLAELNRPNELEGRQRITGTKLGRAYSWNGIRAQLELNREMRIREAQEREAQEREEFEVRQQEAEIRRQAKLKGGDSYQQSQGFQQ